MTRTATRTTTTQQPRKSPAHATSKGWEDVAPKDLRANVTAPKQSTLSPLQQNVVTFVTDGTGNGVVEAVAGAGKTTTLLAVANAVPRTMSGYGVVFNKKNADELKERFPAHVTCGTFHSLWMRACSRNMRSIDVQAAKVGFLVDQVVPHDMIQNGASSRLVVKKEFQGYPYAVKQLVGYAKNVGMLYLVEDTDKNWISIIDHYDIDLRENNLHLGMLIDYAREVLKLNNDTSKRVIDFDDMLYLPLINGWSIEQRDFVLVDEAQDTNAVQRELVSRMIKPTGRAIFVGDPHQAIYGFRGATNDAMTTIQKQFHATKLPLNVSFRCPKAVVKFAQKYVKHIQSADTAIEGEVSALFDNIPQSILDKDTVVVCRNTAPLVKLAYAMIARHIKCTILGRDIGTKLVDVVKRMKAVSLTDLSDELANYAEREIERYTAKKDDGGVQMIEDQVECLTTVISMLDGRATVQDLVSRLYDLFTVNPLEGAVTLCTVHRSKGLEWKRVVLIRPDLMPSPWAKKKWQLQQETNLLYVAVTRAQCELVIVNGEELTIIQ